MMTPTPKSHQMIVIGIQYMVLSSLFCRETEKLDGCKYVMGDDEENEEDTMATMAMMIKIILLSPYSHVLVREGLHLTLLSRGWKRRRRERVKRFPRCFGRSPRKLGNKFLMKISFSFDF